ncbi:MAG: nucleotide exchange factor GrpE [Verrucomicrobia bacterium]|nr:nucleotide exchange factor GrpE [Verrucomicrobiota bacterium]
MEESRTELASDTAAPGNAVTPLTEAEPSAPEPVTNATPTPPLAADQLETLRAQAAQAGANWDRYLRAVADLDNYRKRAAREKGEAAQAAVESLLGKLLPVLDNFEMALAAAADPTTTVESLRSGVTLIQGQLRQALTEAGLEEINALGQPFDPNVHEAVSQLESTEVPESHVLHQLRKGYRLRGRLLRPASVVVARPPTV